MAQVPKFAAKPRHERCLERCGETFGPYLRYRIATGKYDKENKKKSQSAHVDETECARELSSSAANTLASTGHREGGIDFSEKASTPLDRKSR